MWLCVFVSEERRLSWTRFLLFFCRMFQGLASSSFFSFIISLFVIIIFLLTNIFHKNFNEKFLHKKKKKKDEDEEELHENPFFLALQKQSDLFNYVKKERLTVCVPTGSSLPFPLSRVFLHQHIFRPSKEVIGDFVSLERGKRKKKEEGRKKKEERRKKKKEKERRKKKEEERRK